MKTLILLACVVIARACAAPVIEWSLVKSSIAGLSSDILLIESEIVVRADKEELRLEAWRGDSDAVMVDIDVSASDGSKLAKVLSTGPAEAFRKTVVIRPGESRRFVVFTGLFSIASSG